MARRAAGTTTRKGPEAVSPVRCAIYTRKSTDEGLDKDFNTLDAQREAAEAYILSQKHEGWVALPDRYDDGGFTGANTNRPALRRLLADIELGRIDVVVVYKYDRLSRSMLDFLTMLDLFRRQDIAFVSVSQRFDTSTPVGEMTLNILLSFAQFERKLISERTRDKMSAARRRGKWTGGPPPLGYDVAPEGGRLIVNREEAEQVRAIFDLYIEKRSLIAVAQELNRRGWRRKSWTTKDGRRREGKSWDKASVHQTVSDPIYAGLQKLRGETFRGQHAAIVPKALFEKAQRILAENRRSAGATHRNQTGALLRGVSALRCLRRRDGPPLDPEGRSRVPLLHLHPRPEAGAVGLPDALDSRRRDRGVRRRADRRHRDRPRPSARDLPAGGGAGSGRASGTGGGSQSPGEGPRGPPPGDRGSRGPVGERDGRRDRRPDRRDRGAAAATERDRAAPRARSGSASPSWMPSRSTSPISAGHFGTSPPCGRS